MIKNYHFAFKKAIYTKEPVYECRVWSAQSKISKSVESPVYSYKIVIMLIITCIPFIFLWINIHISFIITYHFHIVKLLILKGAKKLPILKRNHINILKSNLFLKVAHLKLKQRMYPIVTDNFHWNLIWHWKTSFKMFSWQWLLYRCN